MEFEYAIEKYGDAEYPEDDYCPSNANMLRGPGQKGLDPFQFVSTKGGDEMAETAKSTLYMAQQQKVQREKILEGHRQQPKFEDSEPWQSDLDTWRRKRKEKIVDKNEDETEKKTNEEIYSYKPVRKAKDEILQINSSSSNTPRQHLNSSSTVSPLRSSSDDLNNDSGIDNRTVESPSTSEFSPRSTDLFASPKSLIDEEPPQHPPPPPPQVEEKLDQVLIPLKFKRTSGYYEQKSPYEENNTNFIETSRHLEKNPYMPVTNAKVEATFKQPPTREGVKPFVSKAAQELTRESENIDLTVELNREQKATVTATKYPRSSSQELVQEEPSRRHHNLQNNQYQQYQNNQHQQPIRSSSTTRIYRAVDIPFDDPPRTKDNTFTLNIIMGSQPVHKGLGFTTNRKDGRLLVESVIVGSPADKAGLLVGDTIVSINGEDMGDKYQSAVTRILHEAARIGEADIMILRTPVQTPLMNSRSSSTTFDRARSVFTENKSFDSYAEFKRKHSRTSTNSSRSSRDYNSLPRASTIGKPPSPVIDRKRDTSLSSYRTARDNFNSPSTTARSSQRSEDSRDYRVTSYHETSSPGKLTDFVPEIDRRSRRDREEAYYGRGGSGEVTPRTIRNYQLTNENGNGNVENTKIDYDGRKEVEQESAVATLKRSTLPRRGGSWKNDYSSEDERDMPEKVPVKTPLRSALKNKTHDYHKKYFSTESLRGYEYSSDDSELDEYSMRYQREQQPFNVVGSYGTRSRSVGSTRRRNGNDDISLVTHRFYDRDGNNVRAPRERSTDIEIRREYGRHERDWREVINMQRQPAPGYIVDRRGIAETSASLSNLPSYINRRMEQQQQQQSQQREYGIYSNPTPPHIHEQYERDEYSRVEERTYPAPAPTPVPLARSPVPAPRTSRDETVVAVSGKHKCAHCNEELGRGAAMIVESLNLFYHLACFKCYVCKMSLGSGATGADVRVRDGRLHCQTCYSNDRVQLSKV